MNKTILGIKPILGFVENKLYATANLCTPRLPIGLRLIKCVSEIKKGMFIANNKYGIEAIYYVRWTDKEWCELKRIGGFSRTYNLNDIVKLRLYEVVEVTQIVSVCSPVYEDIDNVYYCSRCGELSEIGSNNFLERCGKCGSLFQGKTIDYADWKGPVL